jgi:Icc-related predicted phosphoesterase
MKFLFGSDFHGLDSAYSKFSVTLQRGHYDFGVISGDLSTYANDLAYQERFLKSILSGLTKKPVYFIMGNDDGLLYKEQWKTDNNIINIHQKRINLNGLNIVGYHFSPTFIGGSFEKSENEIEKDLTQLENFVDENTVFVTHCPAYGILDKTYSNQHVGSKKLLNFIERKNPKIHLFGHIHESFGYIDNSINGSYPEEFKFFDVTINSDINVVKV